MGTPTLHYDSSPFLNQLSILVPASDCKDHVEDAAEDVNAATDGDSRTGDDHASGVEKNVNNLADSDYDTDKVVQLPVPLAINPASASAPDSSYPENNNLVVKPSLIPGAGLGLFAKTKFKPGSFVIKHIGGMLLSLSQLNNKYNDDLTQAKYVVQIDGSFYRDMAGDSYSQSFARYVNNLPAHNNAFYSRDTRKSHKSASLKATLVINPGDEILAAYGECERGEPTADSIRLGLLPRASVKQLLRLSSSRSQSPSCPHHSPSLSPSPTSPYHSPDLSSTPTPIVAKTAAGHQPHKQGKSRHAARRARRQERHAELLQARNCG